MAAAAGGGGRARPARAAASKTVAPGRPMVAVVLNAASGSQNSDDSGNAGAAGRPRFQELLQPIRDLATNWDIDIANDLEEYLAEVTKITYYFDNQRHALNFAEAALLIQNSASVYSRKVEYLYSLVQQTLELISTKKAKYQLSVDAEGRDHDISVSGHSESDEFLALDDIEESKGIDLVEQGTRPADGRPVTGPMLPQTPSAFQPNLERGSGGIELISTRGDVVGRRDDFRMNTSMVHVSGALLLDVSDFFGVDKNLQPVTDATQQLIIPPSNPEKALRSGFESHSDALQVSSQEQVAVGDRPFGGADYDYGHMDYGHPDSDDHIDEDHEEAPDATEGRFSFDTRLSAIPIRDRMPLNDPWRMLDPHTVGNEPVRPFRKGKSFRIPSVGPTDEKDKTKKRGKKNDDGATTAVVDLAQVLAKLHSAQSNQRNLPKNPEKAPSFPEFDYIFFREQARRSVLLAAKRDSARRKTTGSLQSHFAEAIDDIVLHGDESDDDDMGGGHDNDDDDNGGPADIGSVPFGGADWDLRDPLETHDDGPLPTAASSSSSSTGPVGLVDDIVVHTGSYEELCRQKIEAYLTSAQKYEEQLETSLSKRVREWEERLQPLLTEQEKRPFFDVHRYGGEVITAFQKLHLHTGDTITLADVVPERTEKYEIIRLFMATLHLANNGNVDLRQTTGDQLQLTLRSTAIHDLANA